MEGDSWATGLPEVSSSPGMGLPESLGFGMGAWPSSLESMPAWGPRLACVKPLSCAQWGPGFTLH